MTFEAAIARPSKLGPHSLKNRCRIAGANYMRVYRRMRTGMSFEEATARPSRDDSFTAGQARAAGLRPDLVRKRIRNGWSEEEAISIPPRRPSLLAVKARKAGINPNVVRLRVKRGWSEKNALSIPVCPIARSEVAAMMGLKPTTVNVRIHRYGWSEDEALSTPLRGRPKQYSDLTIKAREAGLNPGVVRDRVYKLGWSEKRALSTPVPKFDQTLSARARAAEMSPRAVSQRVRNGWSEEAALSTPMRPMNWVYYLYLITLPDGQQYLGVTKDVRRRFCRHCCNLRTLLGREIQRQGAPTLRVLAAGHRDFVYELEMRAIAAFNTRVPNGLNVSVGGYGCREPLPSTKAKIAASHIGIRPTQATRNKMSAMRRGKKFSPAACAGISRGLRKRSSEVRAIAAQKMAAKIRGRTYSPEHREALGASHRGKPWSAARRAAQEARRV